MVRAACRVPSKQCEACQQGHERMLGWQLAESERAVEADWVAKLVSWSAKRQLRAAGWLAHRLEETHPLG